jgi:sulfofructose kinase
MRCVQGFDGARSSTSAIIVDGKGERLIVGQRDAGMPSGTSWLPLERIKEADAVLGDVRWLEGIRAVFTRARKEKVPTILDADLGAREALGGILKLTDYAIFCAPALREFAPTGSNADRLEHVLSLGPRHAGVTLGREGYLWRERKENGKVPGFSVSVTDTTGAGDAFHGAFALMVAEGRAHTGVRARRHGGGRAQVHAARLSCRPAVARRARGLPCRQAADVMSADAGYMLSSCISDLSTDF